MDQTGPQNVPMGDISDISTLPSTQLPPELLLEEKQLARFSKTREFKKLKDYLEGRITFFQNNFPDGTPIAKETDHQKIVDYWRATNIVVGEFKALLDVYENANQVVKDESRRATEL
jgi:hypothetical protein